EWVSYTPESQDRRSYFKALPNLTAIRNVMAVHDFSLPTTHLRADNPADLPPENENESTVVDKEALNVSVHSTRRSVFAVLAGARHCVRPGGDYGKNRRRGDGPAASNGARRDCDCRGTDVVCASHRNNRGRCELFHR